jgi:hypothetical protein
MQVNDGFPLQEYVSQPISTVPSLMSGRPADTPLAKQLAAAGARLIEPELQPPGILPAHLWVRDAGNFDDAAYRWLGGIVDVLKRHDAYGVVVDNYRAVNPNSRRNEAEKMFLNDLAHAMFDAVPKPLPPTVNIDPPARGRLKAADAYRWNRVMTVLKRSGAYVAGIYHFQIHRNQRLQWACNDWTRLLRSRGMDEATIERYLPERPRPISWEQANSIWSGLLLGAAGPQTLSRYLDDRSAGQGLLEQAYA